MDEYKKNKRISLIVNLVVPVLQTQKDSVRIFVMIGMQYFTKISCFIS